MKRDIDKIASRVKHILESEERAYMSKDNKVDIYNNVMNEATTTMKSKRKVDIDQREVDCAEFNYHYDNWRTETLILSNINQIFDNANFKQIVNMDRRAVPFIYEKIKDSVDFSVSALPLIYGENVTESDKFIGLERYCKLWSKKIEEEKVV